MCPSAKQQWVTLRDAWPGSQQPSPSTVDFCTQDHIMPYTARCCGIPDDNGDYMIDSFEASNVRARDLTPKNTM